MSFGAVHVSYPQGRQETANLSQPTTYIGSAPDNDLVLADPSVAPYHAQLLCDANGCQILDFGNAGGTRLNQRQLTPNMPEPLPNSATIQIGKVTLVFSSSNPAGRGRALPAQPNVTSSSTGPTIPLAAPNIPARPAPASSPSAPTMRMPAPYHPDAASSAQARVTIDPTNASIEAGGSQLVNVLVTNLGSAPDQFTVRVDHWNDAWLLVTPPRVRLAPGEEGQLIVALQPPRTTEALADRGDVTIVIISETTMTAVASAALVLEIKPFVAFDLSVQPLRAETKTAATYQVTVVNQGNSQQSFDLSAQDDGGAVDLAFDQPALLIEPGGSATARLQARAPRLRRVDGPRTFGIQITARPDRQADRLVQPRMARVQLIARPQAARWIIPAALLLLLLIGGGFALARSGLLDGRSPSANASPEPSAAEETPAPGGARAVDAPATVPAGAGTALNRRFEDTAWQGSRHYSNGQTYDGRTATWIYGDGTAENTMRVSFSLPGAGTGQAELSLTGQDDEAPAKAGIEITVNGTRIFAGPDPLPDDPVAGRLDDGAWQTHTFPFEGSLLVAGTNTIAITNRSPGKVGGPPFLMLDYADLSAQLR